MFSSANESYIQESNLRAIIFFAYLDASLTCSLPLELVNLSRKMVPPSRRLRPNGPAYINSFLATDTEGPSLGQI